MIQQSINIHKETFGNYQVDNYHTSYSHTPYSMMSEQQKQEWDICINAARIKAKGIYKIGDKFNLLTGSQVTVTGFVEDNKEVIKAHGEPCVVYAINPLWQHSRPVRYSLGEIQPDTHVPAEPIIDIKAIGDETNEIPQ